MGRFLLVLAITILVSVSALNAQESATSNTAQASDPLAAIKTDKGLISLTKAAPDLTPVSDYTGDFWNRSTAFDNLFDRQKLYEMGITLDAELTQVVQGIASGGPEDNPGGRYNGLLDYGMSFDTAKLGLWSGGLLAANAMTSWGDSLLFKSGNISPPNYLSVYPDFGSKDTVLMEYYYVQALPKEISVIIGRLNAVNFLDKNRFANDPRNQFLNLSMDNDPLFGAFVSFSTYGILLEIPVTDNIKLQPALFDPNAQPGDYGGTGGFFRDVGTGAQVEISWKLGGNLDGALRPAFLYTSKNTTDFSNPRLVLDVIEQLPVPEKSDNYMFHLNLEQYFWKPEVPAGSPKEVRTADYDFQERGLGVFFRFGIAPEDRNPYDVYVSGGVGGRGIFNSRPYDRCGLGVYWLKESDDLADRLEDKLLQDEVGFDAFYNVALTPWLTLSGDLQWINSGITSSDDLFVLGLRLNTVF